LSGLYNAMSIIKLQLPRSGLLEQTDECDSSNRDSSKHWTNDMNKAHLMNDPCFAGIMFHIESTIHDADSAAASAGVELKDSHIKSCLSKVKTLAKGNQPKAEPKTERERFILELAQKIDKLRPEMRESSEIDPNFQDATPISTTDWLLAVKAVEDSLKNHTVSGTRYYLDFLSGFILKARGY